MCDLQAKVEEGHQALMEVTKCNTECLFSLTALFEEKKELELKLNARQKNIVSPLITFILYVIYEQWLCMQVHGYVC